MFIPKARNKTNNADFAMDPKFGYKYKTVIFKSSVKREDLFSHKTYEIGSARELEVCGLAEVQCSRDSQC